MDDKAFTIRVPKRWARIALIVGVTALIVAPLTAVATHSFSDVPESHTFHGNIEWLDASGVTKGCNPPANTEFCPDDNVTRGQMAAFMERFAEYLGASDGTPAQADNADRAAGLTQVTYATTSESLDSPGQDTAGVSVTATCPSGHLAMGGSYVLPVNNGRFNTTRSEPVDDGQAWRVTWFNTGASLFSGTFTVTAVCVEADGTNNVSG